MAEGHPQVPAVEPRWRRLRLVSLGAAAMLAAAFVAFWMAGRMTVFSPAHLSSPHAALDRQCAACHQARTGISTDRCERCHDASGIGRLRPVAHAASEVPGRTIAALACARCHQDHQGRSAPLTRVDDRLCAECHQFNAFDRHPPLRASATTRATGRGLIFTHARHLARLAPAGCEACHVLRPDGRSFEPISFDRVCASCHLADGVLRAASDPVSRAVLETVVVDGPRPTVTPFDDARVTVTRLTHRDPFVAAALLQWRVAIDPEDARGELLAAAGRLDAARPWPGVRTGGPSGLAAEERRLWDARRALAAERSNQQAAGGQQQSAPASPRTPLDLLADEIWQLARSRPAAPPAAPVPLASPRSALAQVLDALGARPDRASTVTALRGQLGTTPSGDPAGSPSSTRALLEAMTQASDAYVRRRARELLALADDAERRAGGGTDALTRLVTRAALDRELARLAGEPDGNTRRRALELQRELRGVPLVDLEPQEARRRRIDHALARVDLVRALRAQGTTDVSGAVLETAALLPGDDVVRLERTVDLLRDALIAAVPRPAPDAALAAAASLTRACASCHEMDGARMVPVSTDPPLPRARFVHGPHVRQAGCAACHAGIEQSNDVAARFLPSISTCQSCHTRGGTSSGCLRCHSYHPSGSDILARGPS